MASFTRHVVGGAKRVRPEGFGVNHVHAKLFPMHGTGGQQEWSPIKSNIRKYFHRYEGYISSHDGERAEDAELALLAAKIRKANG